MEYLKLFGLLSRTPEYRFWNEKEKNSWNVNTLQISNKDEPKRGALQAFQAGDCRKTDDGE